MNPEPLKNKVCAATEKGIFFEKRDVAAAVEWLKNKFEDYGYGKQTKEWIDEAFEDVVKENEVGEK